MLTSSDISWKDIELRTPETLAKSDRMSKIFYKDNKRLVLKLTVRIDQKQEIGDNHTMLVARLSKDVCNLILDIDDFIVDEIKKNIDPWFIDPKTDKPLIRSKMVREFFQSSIMVRRDGTLGKLHMFNGMSEFDNVHEGSDYQLHVQLFGVRYLKTTCYIVWRLRGITEKKKISNDLFNIVFDEEKFNDADADEDEKEPLENDLAPDSAELQAIRRSLQDELQTFVDVLSNKARALEQDLQRLQNALEKTHEADMKDMNALYIDMVDVISKHGLRT